MASLMAPLKEMESGTPMQMMTAFSNAFTKAMEAMGKLQPETKSTAASKALPAKQAERNSTSSAPPAEPPTLASFQIKRPPTRTPKITAQRSNNLAIRKNRDLTDTLERTRERVDQHITLDMDAPEKRRHAGSADTDSDSDEWRPHISRRQRRKMRKALLEEASSNGAATRSGSSKFHSPSQKVIEKRHSSETDAAGSSKHNNPQAKSSERHLSKPKADFIPAILYEAEEKYQKKVAERYKVSKLSASEGEEDDTDVDENIGSGSIIGEELNGAFREATDVEIAKAAKECHKLVAEVADEKSHIEELRKDVEQWGKAIGKDEKSSYSYFLPHEWEEKKHIREYLSQRFCSIPVEYIKDRSKTLKALLANRTAPLPNPVVPDRTIASSIHLKDAIGESLLVKINAGMEEPFEDTPCQQIPMHEHTLAAMDRLQSAGVQPPEPSVLDLRYPQDEYRRTKEFSSSKNKPCGVLHFACWRQPAYPGEPKPWGHSLSSDILGQYPGDFGARMRFLADMAPVQQAISLWFETIDRQRYKSYRQQVDLMTKANTGLEAVKFANNHSFLGMASLRNVQVRNQRDRGDIRDGWVGMTCTGAFTGGELCLPDLNLKLRFLPGDVIFFRSCALQHFINTTTGERSSLVFFSHSGVTSKDGGSARVTNDYVSCLSEKEQSSSGSPVNGNIAAPTTLSRRHSQALKKRIFSHLPKYPTTRADLTEQKLKRARQRKKRFESFAKEEYVRGKINFEELKRVSRAESPEFYELNLVELARYAKGEYPFAPMEPARKKAIRRAEK
ncbi:hypothetical protein DL98DRAFT_654382 [Cadophora sp. DSE1049]|nr:hypothetical protein DL98DRAFT_654382 [Cadophora sp. DSE1049]